MSQHPPRGAPSTRSRAPNSSSRARGGGGVRGGGLARNADGGMAGDTGSTGGSNYRGRARGGRNRGKSARARGSKRGMRIPPEYLAQVIAQREGRDPASINADLTEDDLNEEEIEEFYKQFSSRPLGSNEARYEEPIVDEEEEEERKEEEESTRRILMEHQSRAQERQDTDTHQSKGNDVASEINHQRDSDDIDHALGATLRAISIRGRKRPNTNDDEGSKSSKMVQIEWDEELEEMSREKASAEARSAMKDRFRGQNSRGHGYQAQKAVKAHPSKALGSNPEMNELEDFLDDLLK